MSELACTGRARRRSRATLLVVGAALLTLGSGTIAAAAPGPGPVARAGGATTWWSAASATCAVRLDDALTTLDRASVGAAGDARASADVDDAATCLEQEVILAPGTVAARLRSVVTDARGAMATDGYRRAVRRGAASAGLRAIAADATIVATRADDVPTARRWLTLRERRSATRIAVPDAPAAVALASLADRDATPAEATAAVRDDLLGTSVVVLRTRIDAVQRRAEDGLLEGAAVAAAQSAAGWSLMSDELRTDDAEHAARMDRAMVALAASARSPRLDATTLAEAARTVDTELAGFSPVAATGDDVAAETAARLARFVELVPVEYGRGVRDGRVSQQLEIQEARSFLRGAFDAWSSLEPVALQRDATHAASVSTSLERLDAFVTRAETTPGDVAPADDVESAATAVRDELGRAVPKDWLEGSDVADLEVVAAALARVDRLAARGDWTGAEQARVEAYGAFEFGPELRLRAIDPSLALDVEALIWFGTRDHDGLASLIAARAAAADVTATTAVLDERLATVETRLGEAATPGAIRTNSAIIVLREGMEAVLILAALTAGLQGAASRRWRRPILVGGLLALVATALTFVVARALLGSLARFGERLEVVVSLVAIGVLLLILNWFVHKAYWTGWMATFQKRKVAITGTARERREATSMQRASAAAQVGGLIVLGFTSIYREGFETVLFLQALVLDAGTLPVLEGAALGMVGVSAIGAATMLLQRRLPYRRMLIATGVLIAVVLASMVGGTTQSMQAIGWLPVHPIQGLAVPVWMTTWLGVHPTWEAIGGQFAAIVFVIGSYVVAEWWQERRRSVRARTARSSRETDAPRVAASRTGGTVPVSLER